MTELSDAQLDELIRREFSAAIADDGFTARVMRVLPRRRRPHAGLLPAAAVIGAAITWVTLRPLPVMQQVELEWLAGTAGAGALGLSAVVLGMGLLASGWALVDGE